MAVILKHIRLAGSKGSEEVEAIFDSGATYSCIQPELAQRLGAPEALPEPMAFGTAKEGERVTATERVTLNFYLDGYRFSDEFMLVPDLSEQAIIGAATLQKWRMRLDFEHDEVIFDPRVTHLRLLRLTCH
ncbi:MAG: retropepsin-like aspartic protease [Anaerolineae bacterium]